MDKTLKALVEALNNHAAACNDANDVESCWFFRGMADRYEACALEDDELTKAYEERYAEAAIYRRQWTAGWNAANAAEANRLFYGGL